MQTRRDQLQAYRFQSRRALAALVTGRPNLVEPPMRRLTVTTVSGIMIAVLLGVGFALFGYFAPTAGTAWRDPGAIIVENDTGASYVLLHDVLHPVLNYPSAVLAVEQGATPHVVHVERSDLDGVRRGTTIGIDGLPESLPTSADLLGAPWSVCSQIRSAAGGGRTVRVSLLAGSNGRARPLPGTDGVLVSTPSSPTRYLIFGGQRLAVGSSRVATALGLENSPTLTVGTAFLDAVPAGPPLRTPQLPAAGEPVPYRIAGHQLVVGELVHATDANRYFLALPEGVVLLDPVQTDLLRTVRLGAGQPAGLDVREVSVLDHLAADSPSWREISAQLAGLPTDVPRVASAPGDAAGLCAIYDQGASAPELAVPPGTAPAFTDVQPSESSASRLGRVDHVALAPGAGALAVAAHGAPTVFLLADPGRLYAFASPDLLTGFGYSRDDTVRVPEALIALLPRGPALDPDAARRPVSG
ncbi:MAG TPA: type VII secretion protein EccB [Jatrophihabitans sp.]|nr:type VII secretion protein EccB [Jatrophihabitans sp.]